MPGRKRLKISFLPGGFVERISADHARRVLRDLLRRNRDYESLDFECLHEMEVEAINYFVYKWGKK